MLPGVSNTLTRAGTPLRSSFHARTNQSVLHHSRVQERSNEFQQPLVLDTLRYLPHQFVVIDSVEKLFQVKIDAPAIAFSDILLRLCHCWMGGSPRSKTVAAFRKRPVPVSLQNLHHRLLDQTIQHRRDAKLSHPTVRFRDFHPPYRLRLLGSVQQLFTDDQPVLFQVVVQLTDSHPVDSGTTLVGLDLPQCFLQIVSLTYFLHPSIRTSWAFGVMDRHRRFDLFPPRSTGFTRSRDREVQFELDMLPLVALEIHVVLATLLVRAFSYRFRLDLSVVSVFRH